MTNYILAWQLLQEKETGRAFTILSGDAITINDIETPIGEHPLLKVAIDLTNLNIKEKIS